MKIKKKDDSYDLQNIKDDQEKLYYSLKLIDKAKEKKFPINQFVGLYLLTLGIFLFLILSIVKFDIFTSLNITVFILIYFIVTFCFINQESH